MSLVRGQKQRANDGTEMTRKEEAGEEEVELETGKATGTDGGGMLENEQIHEGRIQRNSFPFPGPWLSASLQGYGSESSRNTRLPSQCFKLQQMQTALLNSHSPCDKQTQCSAA